MNEQKLELISFSLCLYVQRVRAILVEKNIAHEINYIDLDNPPDWFFDVSPLEKVPVLLVDGKPLFESVPICEYLDETTPGSLHPADPFTRAENRAWIEFGNALLDASYELVSTKEQSRFKQLTAALDEKFDILEEDCLNGTPFFNGEKFSIIDAVYAPIFRYHAGLTQYHDLGFFEDRPQLSLWRDTLLGYDAVIKSMPATYTEEFDSYLRKRESVFSSKLPARA